MRAKPVSVAAMLLLTAPVVAQESAAGAKAAPIPFELTSSKPFVPVRVNDSEPLWFIFDTGNTGGFCIDRKRAQSLGLKLENEREMRSGAGEGVVMKAATTTGVTFTVGNVKALDQSATVLPFDHIATFEGRPVDGLVGRTFIEKFAVEIDYAKRLIHLHDPMTFEYSGSGSSIPIEFLGGLVTTPATVKPPGGEPIEAVFVVDTGARPPIALNRPFVEKHKLRETLPKVYDATIGGGAGGECKGFVGRLERIQLGPFQINAPVVICSEDRSGVLASDAFAGIIGGPILRRSKVFFDYQHKRMILEPYAKVPKPYEYDMSGLFLTAELPDYDAFKVMSVMEDSPAAQAGLKRGDVITAIDGRPAAEWKLERVRQLLRHEGKEYSLEVQRGEDRMRVNLKTKRLI